MIYDKIACQEVVYTLDKNKLFGYLEKLGRPTYMIVKSNDGLPILGPSEARYLKIRKSHVIVGDYRVSSTKYHSKFNSSPKNIHETIP